MEETEEKSNETEEVMEETTCVMVTLCYGRVCGLIASLTRGCVDAELLTAKA